MTENKNNFNTKEEKLTPKRDFVFKALFGKIGNESILIDLLESILELTINSVSVIPEAQLPVNYEEEKYGKLDLKVTLNDGTLIDIEIQMRDEKNIKKRMLFYGSSLVVSQLKKGQNYNKIRDVIIICITNFDFLDVEEYHNSTVMVLKKHRDYIVDTTITYHYIELPKFRRTKPDIENKLFQWLTFIDGENREMVKLVAKKNIEVKKAQGLWDYLEGDENMKRLEELREKRLRDDASMLENAKDEGIEIGIKKGKIEIAKKMLKSQIPIRDIIQFTNLSKEEIEKIRIT